MTPWVYSVDLRKRAVAARQGGNMSVVDAAILFRVGERTLYAWPARFRAGKTLAPLLHQSSNKPRFDAQGAVVVHQIIAEIPDATSAETATYFVERTHKP